MDTSIRKTTIAKRSSVIAKLQIWTPEQAKQELAKRLNYCRTSRKNYEYSWEENERTLYNTRGKTFSPDLSISFESEVEIGVTEIDQSNTDVGVNYTLKNMRYIHSQLSANPPSVVVRPTSSDPSDRRKADAADRLIRYSIREYQMQELFDLATNNVLQYGTGFIKSVWDPEKGDIIDMDEESGEVIMEGDISFTVPATWDIYLDPDASCWNEVKYIFERVPMPYEEALYRFGEEKKDILEKYRIHEEPIRNDMGARTALDQKRYDIVEIYQYWEKGLPFNGMIGRFAWVTKDGDLLSPVQPNPFRFSPPADRGHDLPGVEPVKKQLPAKAYLPYHIMTDLDVPGLAWGRSMISYQAPLQDIHNRLLNVTVDCLQAHGVARIILPEGAEISDDSITNSPWDVIKITGNQPPHFMEPMPLPATLQQLLGQTKQYIDDMAGINESMFGQQTRQQSGFSMQYATNQGNMIRRRLFNKYVLLTESVYKSYLDLVRKHWTEVRTIYVLGKEKSFEALDIKGADIDGGFNIVVEYGASLSLDPTSRREEIITLLPLFQQAGVETRVILQMLKLNELESLDDIIQMADDRQREIFEEMIATGTYIPPQELQDHKNMLSYAYRYVMTSEYKYLEPENQLLVQRHIKEREQLAAQGANIPGATVQGASPVGPQGAQPGGQQPQLGAQPRGQLPTLPGANAPLDITQLNQSVGKAAAMKAK